MGVIFSNGVYIGLIPNGGDVTPTPTPTPSPTPIITFNILLENGNVLVAENGDTIDKE